MQLRVLSMRIPANNTNRTTSSIFQSYWNAGKISFNVICILTILLIIVTNILVIRKVYLKIKSKRAELLFFILSLSNLTVGIISLPIIFVYINSKALHILVPVRAIFFFTEIPYTLSWFLAIVIALDRCFIITNFRNYLVIASKKRMLCFIISLFIAYTIVVIIFVVTSCPCSPVVIVINIILFVVTVSSYLYLRRYVHKNSFSIRGSKSSNSNNKKVTKAIVFIFLCMLILETPMLLVLIIGEIDYNLVNEAQQWTLIIQFSNCYANALLYLYNH